MNKKLQILMMFLIIPTLSFSAEHKEATESDKAEAKRIARAVHKKALFASHQTLMQIDSDQNPFKEITSGGVAHPKYFVHKIDDSIYYVDPSTTEYTEDGVINLKKLKITAIVFHNGDRVDFDDARTFTNLSTNLFTNPRATYKTTSISFNDGSRVSEDLEQQAATARARKISRTAPLNDFIGNELSPEEAKWLSAKERIRRREATEAQKAAESNKGWFSWIWS